MDESKFNILKVLMRKDLSFQGLLINTRCGRSRLKVLRDSMLKSGLISAAPSPLEKRSRKGKDRMHSITAKGRQAYVSQIKKKKLEIDSLITEADLVIAKSVEIRAVWDTLKEERESNAALAVFVRSKHPEVLKEYQAYRGETIDN